jgi:hypothetical protein
VSHWTERVSGRPGGRDTTPTPRRSTSRSGRQPPRTPRTRREPIRWRARTGPAPRGAEAEGDGPDPLVPRHQRIDIPPRSSNVASTLSAIAPTPSCYAIQRRPQPTLVSSRIPFSIHRSSYQVSYMASRRSSSGLLESGFSPEPLITLRIARLSVRISFSSRCLAKRCATSE